MHELSIAEGILEIVERTARANDVKRVKAVRVSIGELAGVDIPSLEFAWTSVRKGGPAENAALEIERPRGEAWCLACEKTVPLKRYGDPCPVRRLPARRHRRHGNEGGRHPRGFGRLIVPEASRTLQNKQKNPIKKSFRSLKRRKEERNVHYLRLRPFGSPYA